MSGNGKQDKGKLSRELQEEVVAQRAAEQAKETIKQRDEGEGK